MSNPTVIRIDQRTETPVTDLQRKRYGLRYAYARSSDSQSTDDPGQDYLVVVEDGDKLVFALCDGVSQSFYGDLSARFLGEELVKWFWQQPTKDSASLKTSLADQLSAITTTASRLVDQYQIPPDVSPMVKDVLEQKRKLGSETTFITGCLNYSDNSLSLAWLGDSRLRLWNRRGEVSGKFSQTFNTAERWSSLKGIIGELHVATLPLNQIEYLMVYSDGLAVLDETIQHHVRTETLISIMATAQRMPQSDDISFLQVWNSPSRPKEKPAPGVPTNLKIDKGKDRLLLAWKGVRRAEYYEIQSNHLLNRRTSSDQTSMEIPFDNFSEEDTAIFIRAWSDSEPGPWSQSAALPSLPKPIAPPLPPKPRPVQPVQSQSLPPWAGILIGLGALILISSVVMFVFRDRLGATTDEVGVIEDAPSTAPRNETGGDALVQTPGDISLPTKTPLPIITRMNCERSDLPNVICGCPIRGGDTYANPVDTPDSEKVDYVTPSEPGETCYFFDARNNSSTWLRFAPGQEYQGWFQLERINPEPSYIQLPVEIGMPDESEPVVQPTQEKIRKPKFWQITPTPTEETGEQI